MNILKRIALFAINNPLKEKEIESIMATYNIPYKRVLGSYKDTLEDSYVAIVDDDRKLELVKHLANRFKQESILIVNEDRKAYLYYLSLDQMKYIGWFKAIDSIKARELDSWTLSDGVYYACV